MITEQIQQMHDAREAAAAAQRDYFLTVYPFPIFDPETMFSQTEPDLEIIITDAMARAISPDPSLYDPDSNDPGFDDTVLYYDDIMDMSDYEQVENSDKSNDEANKRGTSADNEEAAPVGN